MAALTEAIDSFAASLALERGLAAKTCEAYGRDVRAFVRFAMAGGKSDTGQLEQSDVLAWLQSLQKKRRDGFPAADAVPPMGHSTALQEKVWHPLARSFWLRSDPPSWLGFG